MKLFFGDVDGVAGHGADSKKVNFDGEADKKNKAALRLCRLRMYNSQGAVPTRAS
jgi:hypothetical protein